LLPRGKSAVLIPDPSPDAACRAPVTSHKVVQTGATDITPSTEQFTAGEALKENWNKFFLVYLSTSEPIFSRSVNTKSSWVQHTKSLADPFRAKPHFLILQLKKLTLKTFNKA